MSSPLIVAGMHRSGTSLAASYLQAAGVDMGRSIAPDRTNPAGFFEDAGFLDLNRRMLEEMASAGDGGHPDWGWTETGSLDFTKLESFRGEATALVETHDNGHRWGWKDPRNTILLDFWEQAVHAVVGSGPSYLLLYRYPWDVADSIQRLGAPVFLEHPEYAYRIWQFYSRRLLEFWEAHRDRAVLASINAAVAEPAAFSAAIEEKTGLDLSGPSLDDLFDATLFHSIEGSDPLIDLVAATSSDCVDLLTELDAAADLSSAGRWRAKPLSAGVGAPDRGPEPRISIVTPCHNHGQFLIEAVASVERTAPEGTELVIVNDGSTEPRTLEVLATLREAGYCVLDQKNKGLSGARNAGIAAARGRYILPLDADNRLRRGFINAAVEILDEEPEIGVVYGDRMEFGLRSGRAEQAAFDLERILGTNYIDACAVYRRDLWEDLEGYDEKLAAWEDWDLWIGAAEEGWGFRRIDTPAFDYRVRPASLLKTMDDPAVHRRVVGRICQKHAVTFAQNLERLFPTLQHAMLEARRRLGETEAVCQAQASRIEDLEQELETRLAWVRRVEAEGVERDARVRELDEELAERLAWARGLEREVEAKTARILELQDEQVERLEWARGLEGEVEAKTARILELQKEQEERLEWARGLEEEVEEKRARILELQTEQDERLQWARDLEAEVESKTSRILELQEEHDERLRWARTLEAEGEARQERIVALQNELEERLAWVRAVEGRLERRDEALAKQTALAQAARDETATRGKRIDELELELEMIRSGRVFRAAGFWWRLRDRLLPEQSGRKRVYDWLIGHLTGTA